MSAVNDSEKERLKNEETEQTMPPNEADPPTASSAAAKMDPEAEPLNAAASADDSKVKFIGGNDNVDIEKGASKKDEKFSPALTKSELMKYATDPFWVKLRWILFVLFWVAWLAMLVGAVVIIIYAEKCPSPAPKKWWQKKPVYEVYVKSFKDSDDNGSGDLKGVTSKLDYLKNLGVGSVYLTGFYKSMGGKDAALDMSDHKEVDADYGTFDDFKALVDGVHEKEMKLIIDFIPKHTSDDDAIELLNFWSDEGVDGFRVGQSFLTYDNHNTNENLEVLKKMRKVLDEKSVEDDGNGKILMTEMKDSNDLLPYYGDVADRAGIGKIAQMPLNFNLAKDDFKNNFAKTLQTSIENYLSTLKVSNSSHWPNFCLGNHDYSRAASRFGEDKVDFMNMLLLMLPGTPFTYYGEEIGMIDGSGAAPDKYRANMDWSKAEAEEENVHIKAYKMVAKLRETQTILFGDTGFIIDQNSFVMSRIRKGNPGYLLISNLGDNEASLDISGVDENDEPKIKNMAKRGTLDLAIPTDEKVEVGATLDLTGITIPAKTTYLMTFVPDFSG